MRLTRKPNPPFLATTVADPSPVADAEVVTAVALAAGLLASVAAPPPNTMTYRSQVKPSQAMSSYGKMGGVLIEIRKRAKNNKMEKLTYRPT